MKKFLLTLILLTTFTAFAEDVNVTVNGTPSTKATKKYEINEGTEDIAGDKSTLKKTSEQNWKKACNEWRTDFKETNKNNIIISHSCGVMDCTKAGVETTCFSKTKYKVKTLVEE